MGHQAAIFRMIDHLGVKPGNAVADFGSQDIQVSSQDTLDQLNADLASLYGSSPITAPIPSALSAKTAFLAAGFSYTCFDVDRREDTVFLDFNTFNFQREWYGRFDLVMNAGTSEHLASPIALMFFAHQAVRVGGLIRHNVPMFGWGNHGYCNLTPKFWQAIAVYNGYDIVRAQLHPSSREVRQNHYGPHLSFMNGLEGFDQSPAMVTVIYRKKTGCCFIPPVDLVPEATAQDRINMCRNALKPFVACGSITQAEADAAIAERFGLRAAAE